MVFKFKVESSRSIFNKISSTLEEKGKKIEKLGSFYFSYCINVLFGKNAIIFAVMTFSRYQMSID